MNLTPAIETGAAMDAAGSASAAPGPDPWAASARGKGKPEGWLSASNGSSDASPAADASQPLSGESFSASWQSVLRAWGMTGVVAQRAGSTAATGTSETSEPGAKGGAQGFKCAADLRAKISQPGTGAAVRSMTATGKENGPGPTLPATGEIGKSAATMAHTASGQQRIRAYAAEVLTSEQSTDAPAAAGTVMDRKSASEQAAGAARGGKSEKAASALGEAKATPQAGSAGAAAIVQLGDAAAAAAPPLQAENLPAGAGSAPDSKIADHVVTADAVQADAEATATALATSAWNKFPVYVDPAALGTATQIGTGSRSVGHNAEAASQRAPLSSEADAATVTRSESGEKAAEPPSTPGPRVRAAAGQSRNVEASERSGQAANAAGREPKTPATEAGTQRKLAAKQRIDRRAGGSERRPAERRQVGRREQRSFRTIGRRAGRGKCGSAGDWTASCSGTGACRFRCGRVGARRGGCARNSECSCGKRIGGNSGDSARDLCRTRFGIGHANGGGDAELGSCGRAESRSGI